MSSGFPSSHFLLSYCFMFCRTLVTIWNYLLSLLFICLLPLISTQKIGSYRKWGLVCLIHHCITAPVMCLGSERNFIWPVRCLSSWPSGLGYKGLNCEIINSMDGEERLHIWPGNTEWVLTTSFSFICSRPCFHCTCTCVIIVDLLVSLPPWLLEDRDQVSCPRYWTWWPAEWVHAMSAWRRLLAQGAWEHAFFLCFAFSNRKRNAGYVASNAYL